MSKIIGTEKVFFKNAVINDENIPSVTLRIRGGRKVKGRNLYGFFVTNEEFADKLAQIYCSDGIYDVPVLEYKTGESIILATRYSEDTKSMKDSQTDASSEFSKKIEAGTFIVQSDINIRKQLLMHQIPIRKIRFWHRLGWAFAK
jgi:hypothetical protein